MRKASKVVSIILAVFMLMQTAVCMAEEGTSASIESPSAVKVCYDLGILPNVYEDADKIVTYDEFMSIYTSITGDTCKIDKNGDNITAEQIYTAFCQSGIPIYDNAVASAYAAGYSNGVVLYREANITYAQLARIIYNFLTGIKWEITAWRGYEPDLSSAVEVKNSALFEYGYVKYRGDVTVSGDTATVNGKLYNRENYNGTDVKDVVLNIADKDLTSGSNYELFVKDDTIVSAISLDNLKNETVSKDMTPPAAPTTVIILKIGDVNATVNGENIANDVAPMVINDRTMLPIRFIAEALGATVTWVPDLETVMVSTAETEIYIAIGNNFARVNRETVDLDSPAFVENDRTYLPLRFIAENLGAEVQWDEATQTVTITK